MKGKTRKVVKKIMVYLLVFALCIPFMDMAAENKTAKAETFTTSYDGNWYYIIKTDGTVGICGYLGYVDFSSLVIPATIDGLKVTSIEDFAFYGYSNLTEVVISEGVTAIGDYVFAFCNNLTEVVIPEGINAIGDYAFAFCDNLTEVVIPEGATAIGDCAFCCCSNLAKVVVPGSVKSMGIDVFSWCLYSLVIYTPSGSTAEDYANRYGITVQADSGTIPPTSAPTPTPTVTPTPPPTPTPTPTITPTPTPKLQVSVNKAELSVDAQGNISDNRVDISLTGFYDCTVSTGSSSWLKVCKKNASASAANQIWISNSGKEGTCSFYVFADENTAVKPRTGEITVTAGYGDKALTAAVEVTQEAAKAVLDVSVSEITANSKGRTSVSSVKVDTNKSGGFSVDNDGNSWIKVGSGSYEGSAKSKVSFESNGTFYVFVTENPSDEERTGRIIVTHEDGETQEIIQVRQDGAAAVLTVDSTSKTVEDSGTFYNNAVYVETSDTGSFTATVEDAAWLKVSSDKYSSFADGMTSITMSGNGYIYLVADKNNGDERSATIKITHEGGKISKTVTVTQLGKAASYLQVDRETAYFDEPVRAIDGMVHISAGENTKWTVTSSESWIRILKDNWAFAEEYASIEGMGTGGFYILVKENDTYEGRSGYVTISAPGMESHKIYVYQAENEVSLDSLLKELSISVSKKTFKKGKTAKIKLNYPEGLYASDVRSVTFSSSKKKVATVNSKGVIKGIKKGKAVITVKVTLENGSSRTFKAKITVAKRKVKVAKFK